MLIRHLSYLIVILALYSCSSSTPENNPDQSGLSPEQKQVRQLEKQVIELHDEIMPLMGTLISFKDQLEQNNQELAASNEPSAQDQVILNDMVIKNLDLAHEGMMSWMRNYQGVDVEENVESNLKYLEEEKQKMLDVQEQVNSSIKAAEEALGIGGAGEQ